jgi:thiamine-phosphate pyrophosphorylase
VSDLSAQSRPKLSVNTTIRGFYAVLDRADEDFTRRLVSHEHGGARVLQLRIKPRSPKSLDDVARMAREVTRRYGAALIINDDLELALSVGADGVHLGQEDMSLRDARERVMGYRATLNPAHAQHLPPFWIGISTHNLEQVTAACRGGADYLGFGPVFATLTKKDPDAVVGMDLLRAACAAATVPVVAIGGITAERVPSLYQAGASAICAISAVNNSLDPSFAARLMSNNNQ